MGWPFVGAPEIGTVALSAVGLVENVAFCDKSFVLGRDAGFGCAFRATRDDEHCDRKKPGECVAGVDELAPWTTTPSPVGRQATSTRIDGPPMSPSPHSHRTSTWPCGTKRRCMPVWRPRRQLRPQGPSMTGAASLPGFGSLHRCDRRSSSSAPRRAIALPSVRSFHRRDRPRRRAHHP